MTKILSVSKVNREQNYTDWAILIFVYKIIFADLNLLSQMYFFITSETKLLKVVILSSRKPNKNFCWEGIKLQPLLSANVQTSSIKFLIIGHVQNRWETSSKFVWHLQYEHTADTLCLKRLTIKFVCSEFLTIWYCSHFSWLSKVMAAQYLLAEFQNLMENCWFNSVCHLDSRKCSLLFRLCFLESSL